MKEREEASEWVNAFRHIRGRDLAWHLSAITSPKVLNEALKLMNIRTVQDLIDKVRED